MSRTVIDVWVADLTFPGYMDRMRRMAREFGEAHPEYAVEIKGHDFRELPLEIARAAAHGRPPAVAECYFYVSRAIRDLVGPDGRPVFTSVEKAIGGRTEILGEPVVIDDLIPAVRGYYTYQGDLTSMPSVATTMLLYANRTLLDRAGVTRLPATWAEVEAACDAVAALPGGPSHTITWANHGLFFQQALAVQGGRLVDNDNGRSAPATTVDLATPEMLAWVEWWRRLHRKGHYLYTGKIPDWEGNLKAFATQEVAFRITSSNDLNYMVQAAENAGFEIEVGRFPVNDEVPYAANAIAGTSLWLADGLDERTRDGALAFLQYMHNARNAADQHKINSFIPVTGASTALLEQEGWYDRHPYHRVAGDQLRSYPPGAAPAGAAGAPPVWGPLFGDFAGVQDVMTRAMADVLLHDADPVARFTQATAEAQELLDAYRADARGTGPRRPESVRVEYFRDAEPYSGADLENVVQLSRG
ncbi:extracellular solute-binding protein [Microbispora sp. ZYX-F-249]|uniref:Extracellular solute-binding protein n=1 Tax=Microbispora maris TaxID=3144104 RepID=A0ABV0AXD7_9ACTN